MAGICRGALIVLEGCDRAGKTTQCNRLVAALRDVGHDVKQLHFPGQQPLLLPEPMFPPPMPILQTGPLYWVKRLTNTSNRSSRCMTELYTSSSQPTDGSTSETANMAPITLI